MCITIPQAIKDFYEDYLPHIGIRKRNLLAFFTASIVTCPGKRTYTALGQAILTEHRSKSSPQKFFSKKRFYSRNIHRTLIQTVVNEIIKKYGSLDNWVILIDGTASRRGGFTKIENATKYRKKSRHTKGVSSKAHMFVMGVLIAPNGMRIPFTRYTYYTKKYCKKHGKKHMTQNQLAAKMVCELREYLPAGIKPVVVADSYFDSQIMFEICRRNNMVFITTADSDRNYIHHNGSSAKLHNRGKSKSRKDYRTFRIVPGQEKWTRPHSRCSNPKGKRKHVYRVTGETLNVSKLGDTRVVFSWKKKTGLKRSGRESFRVLLCSETSMSDGKIVELYALRWQVEIFFRELKSDIGLEDYCGRDFHAYERFVDMCLMSFLFLEWYRMEQINATGKRKESANLKVIRTRGMIRKIRMENMSVAKEYIRELKRGNRGPPLENAA